MNSEEKPCLSGCRCKCGDLMYNGTHHASILGGLAFDPESHHPACQNAKPAEPRCSICGGGVAGLDYASSVRWFGPGGGHTSICTGPLKPAEPPADAPEDTLGPPNWAERPEPTHPKSEPVIITHGVDCGCTHKKACEDVEEAENKIKARARELVAEIYPEPTQPKSECEGCGHKPHGLLCMPGPHSRCECKIRQPKSEPPIDTCGECRVCIRCAMAQARFNEALAAKLRKREEERDDLLETHKYESSRKATLYAERDELKAERDHLQSMLEWEPADDRNMELLVENAELRSRVETLEDLLVLMRGSETAWESEVWTKAIAETDAILGARAIRASREEKSHE